MSDTPKRRPGRPKGLGKVPGSGRKKGTPNKHSAEMREYIAKHSNDVAFLCQVAAGKRFYAADPKEPNKRIYLYPSIDQRIQASQILLRKHSPDLKGIELDLPGGEDLIIKVNVHPHGSTCEH